MLYVKPDDLIKILNVLQKHGHLLSALKHDIIDLVIGNRAEYTYEVIADLAMEFATNMDQKHTQHFFDKFMDKFMRDIPHLKEDTLYKLLWACIKAGRLTTEGDWYKWQ